MTVTYLHEPKKKRAVISTLLISILFGCIFSLLKESQTKMNENNRNKLGKLKKIIKNNLFGLNPFNWKS